MLTSNVRKGLAASAAVLALTGGLLVAAPSGAGARPAADDVTAQAPWALITSTTATASPSSALLGVSVTLSAQVVVEPLPTGTVVGSAMPDLTGTVTFQHSSGSLGSGEVDETGAVSVSTSSLPVGANKVIASYSGDDYHEASQATVVVTIEAPATTTTTTVPAPTPAPSAPAGTYTTSNGTTSASLTVAQGGSIPVSGSGWLPGSELEIWLHSDPVLLGKVTIGSGGSFSTRYPTPAGTPLGAHSVVMTGTAAGGEAATVVLALQVVAAPAAAESNAPSRLAFTG